MITIATWALFSGLLLLSVPLIVCEKSVVKEENFFLGKYELILKRSLSAASSSSSPSLQITKKGKDLWRSSSAVPWLLIADATQDRPPIQDGNYQVSYQLKELSNALSVDSASMTEGSLGVQLKGSLLQCSPSSSGRIEESCESRGSFEFFVSQDEDNQLQFSATITPSSSLQLNEVHTLFSFTSFPNESFHGFGESFTFFDLTGKKVPILVSEQGVGRDEQPITDYLNTMVGEGVGGHWYTTYAPKPLFVTNHNRSIGLAIQETSFFDLTRASGEEGIIQIDVWTSRFTGKLLSADRLTDLVSVVSRYTGRQSVLPLPKWTQEGAIVGLEGGTENVTKIVNDLLAGGVPIAGVWLQDWVGLRHSWDGDRLIWNWEVNYDHYPGWNEMVEDWKQKGIRVLTYLNPFFSDPSGFVAESELRHNFYREGLDKGYFVRKSSDNSTYLMNSLSIEFATLDLTNPEARSWMKGIIINQTLIEAGSSGWMCDFGEYLPFDAIMADGTLGSSYHNYYPQAWAELTVEAIQEYYEQQGLKAEESNEIVYFMRSAWTFSPPAVPVFWLGDQLMSWDGNDGIKTVITGALSSGLTGHAITHSDIGGYTAQLSNVSSLDFERDSELLQRWTELAAFGFGLFRTHIGSSTSPSIAQIYDSAESIAHFARFASIYSFLSDYRSGLIQEANKVGLPLVRPLVFSFGFDLPSWGIDREFLFGEDFLVAPCLDSGKNSTSVYFPPLSGLWRSIWDSEGVVVDMRGAERGIYREIASPIGFPPVFFQDDPSSPSSVGRRLAEMIRTKGWDLTASSSVK